MDAIHVHGNTATRCWSNQDNKRVSPAGTEETRSLATFLKMTRGFIPQGVHNKAAMTDDVIDLYLVPWSIEEGKKALFRNVRRLNPEYTQAIADELKHLPQTLILWAKHNVFQKPRYALELQKTIPNAELNLYQERRALADGGKAGRDQRQKVMELTGRSRMKMIHLT